MCRQQTHLSLDVKGFLANAPKSRYRGMFNQRHEMTKWLNRHHWRYVIDKNGLPKVARAYYNRKLGIDESKGQAKYDDAPNLAAFA